MTVNNDVPLTFKEKLNLEAMVRGHEKFIVLHNFFSSFIWQLVEDIKFKNFDTEEGLPSIPDTERNKTAGHLIFNSVVAVLRHGNSSEIYLKFDDFLKEDTVPTCEHFDNAFGENIYFPVNNKEVIFSTLREANVEYMESLRTLAYDGSDHQFLDQLADVLQ